MVVGCGIVVSWRTRRKSMRHKIIALENSRVLLVRITIPTDDDDSHHFATFFLQRFITRLL